MAEGILGLGGGGSAALSNEVIDKIKAAERRAKVEPLETDLENWALELEKVSGIEAKVLELLGTIKPFDLFSSSANAFEQMSASSSGTSALFDAEDVSSLTPGTVSVHIDKLAKKDVFQSDAVDGATKDTALGAETLTIQVGTGTAVDFDTTGKTYQELADEINLGTGLNASVEEIGTDSYRLVIKSLDTGLDNALTISGTASQTLGYTTDGITENVINHILTAQNMEGTIDSVSYNISSNSVTTQGLTITAVELGDSSVSIQKDTSALTTLTEDFITKYNELVDLIEEEAFSADSPVDDIDSLKMILSSVKDMIFSNYGTSDDKNVFNYGFELDTSGHLSLDATTFSAAITDDYDGLKELFLGVAEDKGLGTVLKEYIGGLNGFDGILTIYDENLIERKSDLEKEKEQAIKDLDSKYSQMSMQFAAYGTIIAKMEASFGGLKMMIQQSVSS